MNALRTSWRMMIALLLSLVIQINHHGHALAQTPESAQRSFLLGTGSTGGMYHPIGVALSTLVKLKLLPSLNVDLTAVNTDGSNQNVELMQQGDVQFAILSALAGHEANEGIGQLAESESGEELRAITTLWFSTDHIIVRKDAVQSGTIKDLAELRGQSMSFGRENSGTRLSNRALLEPLGMQIDSDFDLAELNYAESAEAFVSGDIVGMSVSGGLPVGAVEQVFNELGDEVAVLEFDDKQLAAIDQGRRLWDRVVIPAGTYPGQDRDIFSVGTPNILAVRADVDDDVVYQITKTIFEELDYLHGLHAATSQISLDTAVDNLPLPIHDGALRYFEEKGVELPAAPVELSPDLLARFDNATQAREVANRGVISMFTGANGDTSAHAAADLASVLNTEESGFRLTPTYGGGAAQNLTDLLYRKDVDSAMVRADIIAYAAEHEVYPAIDSKIAYITEMFPEEVHLVVQAEIGDVQDLIGKKVSIGRSGSGTDITASIILSMLDIAVEPIELENYQALGALRGGEISGAFFVGGKPMPLLQEISDGSGLKLLPVPFVQYADSYRPTSIARPDYPNLMTDSEVEEIPTLSVRTALFTYLWQPGSDRYQALFDFSNVIFNHLQTLQQDGYHPKWREVDPTAEIAGLIRFEPARTWVQENATLAGRIAQEGQDLVDELSLTPSDLEGRDPLIPPLSLDAALSPKAQPPGAETERSSVPGPGAGNDEVQRPTPVEAPSNDDPVVLEKSATEPAPTPEINNLREEADNAVDAQNSLGVNQDPLSSTRVESLSIKPTF